MIRRVRSIFYKNQRLRPKILSDVAFLAAMPTVKLYQFVVVFAYQHIFYQLAISLAENPVALEIMSALTPMLFRAWAVSE